MAFNNKSAIIKENEFDFINLAIKSRINKDVKELKKLYQATIDGDEAINFHSKCDNIPNTLVIIKSAGNRRFGGFISQSCGSKVYWADDPNAFYFLLINKKFILIKIVEMLFIIRIILAQHLGVDILYILVLNV